MMKRFFVMVLALCLVVIPAMSEDLSFDAYSDSELITMLEKLQAEIAHRHIEKTALLYEGIYVGGQDIPTGVYDISSAGESGEGGIISLCGMEDGKEVNKVYQFKEAEEDYRIHVSIAQGDRLSLPFAHHLAISAGIRFE